MKVLISKDLQSVIISSGKNINYSMNFFLDSLDLDTCLESMKLVKEFELTGNRVEVEIDDSNVKTIQRVFGNTENALIEQLLWISSKY